MKQGLSELLARYWGGGKLAAGEMQIASLPVGGRDCPVVAKRVDDVVAVVVGDAGQGHLELGQVLDNLGRGVAELVKGRVGDASVLAAYGRVCLAVDECVLAGAAGPLTGKEIRERVELSELNR